MKLQRSISEPIRHRTERNDSWAAEDRALIACWERGREKSTEDPELASRARDDQLVMLPWKGGVEKATKKNKKYGTLYYLAMWQGLRCDNLDIDTDEEPARTCPETGMTVIFTNDFAKYANA